MSNTGEPESGPRRRLVLGPASRPVLARHVKLRFDATRNCWLLLAPERLLTPSDTAVAVLELCDGQRTIADMAAMLASEFDAPPDTILADVLPVLQELSDKAYLIA